MSEDPGSTSLDIAVITRDPSWCEVEPQAEALARRAAQAALLRAGGPAADGAALEAAVVLADDAMVRGLNRTYRGEDRPTNVLSFGNLDDSPAAGRPRLLGDVILARQTVGREAAEQRKSLADHLTHLVVHGVLHLLGYDHESEPQAEEMESLEIAILAELGVSDPYRRFDGGQNTGT
jgi:probable rRNA maturation factor